MAQVDEATQVARLEAYDKAIDLVEEAARTLYQAQALPEGERQINDGSFDAWLRILRKRQQAHA